MKTAPWIVLLPALATVWLSGCSVGPDYREPNMPVPADWSEPVEGGVTRGQTDVSQWWTTFGDPTLDALVARAVTANYDLRMAEARLRQSRAQREAVAADFWPVGNASASYTRQRISGNTTIAGLAGSLTGGPGAGSAASDPPAGALPSGFPLESNLYQTGFDAAWEMDMFGGQRRALEAATADLEASADARRGALVSLLAEVARDYVELRGLQRRLALAQETIVSQRETLQITRQRVQGALAGELDVAQASALLSGTQAQVPALEASIRQTIHKLSVLLGQPPDALTAELSPAAPLPAGPPPVPIGLPSDLLRRRPDIRQAERQLASATAQIGVQVAELFPKFSLTGSVGLQSADAGNWFTGDSRYWSFGPAVRWRVFDTGRIKAQVRARNARQEEALANYEKTVLTALQEVEDALVAYAKERVRYGSLQEQVESNRQALGIANDRYVRGVGSFLDVLDSQRALYQAQDQASQSEKNVCADLIVLYKALGGGWTGFEATSAPLPAGESSHG
jgi:NodT family efflux transporter outer membrane factor (OMF) lipoprotein